MSMTFFCSFQYFTGAAVPHAALRCNRTRRAQLMAQADSASPKNIIQHSSKEEARFVGVGQMRNAALAVLASATITLVSFFGSTKPRSKYCR
jgi:hypothetical protein